MQAVLSSLAYREMLWFVPEAGASLCAQALTAYHVQHKVTAFGWHHASARMQQRSVGAERWARTYSFAVVRNPWTRAVSSFFFCKQLERVDGDHATPTLDELREEYRLAVHEQLARERVRKAADVHDCLINVTTTCAWFPQLPLLTDAQGAMLVNDVYKLE